MPLNVTFSGLISTEGNPAPLGIRSSNSTETIAVGRTSTQGAIVAESGTRVVTLLADEACWVEIGANPTAVAGSGWKMNAGERLNLWVNVGEKVAVITV